MPDSPVSHPRALPPRLLAMAAAAVATTLSPMDAATARSGGDWPQFLGPERSGVAPSSPPLAERLPDGGAPVEWRHTVGAGFAGPVVAGSRVFLFHRQGDTAVIEAMDRSDGTTGWRFSYGTEYRDDFGFDDGPRSPPTVAGDRLVAYGAEGLVHCLEAATGRLVWKRDVVEAFGSRKGFFGRCGAPLVAAGRVLLNIGGTRRDGAAAPTGIVALSMEDGTTAWTATDHEGGYSSPILHDVHGREPLALFLTRDGFVGLEAASGSIRFERPYRASIDASVNAASPVACGDGRIFLSACYGVGASLWPIGSDGTAPDRPDWRREEVLDCHFATPVFVDGHLFGFHGRQERGQELRCVGLDGTVRWTTRDVGTGQLVAADGKLVIVTEDGELVIAAADPAGYRELWRDQVLARGARAAPALADGRLFARGTKELVALDLRAMRD